MKYMTIPLDQYPHQSVSCVIKKNGGLLLLFLVWENYMPVWKIIRME